MPTESRATQNPDTSVVLSFSWAIPLRLVATQDPSVLDNDDTDSDPYLSEIRAKIIQRLQCLIPSDRLTDVSLEFPTLHVVGLSTGLFSMNYLAKKIDPLLTRLIDTLQSQITPPIKPLSCCFSLSRHEPFDSIESIAKNSANDEIVHIVAYPGAKPELISKAILEPFSQHNEVHLVSFPGTGKKVSDFVAKLRQSMHSDDAMTSLSSGPGTPEFTIDQLVDSLRQVGESCTKRELAKIRNLVHQICVERGTDPTQDILTCQQVAEIAGVHESRIRQMVRSGDIQAVKCGRAWRIPKSEAIRVRDEVPATGRPRG